MIYLTELLKFLIRKPKLHFIVLILFLTQFLFNTTQAEELSVIVNRNNPVKEIPLRDIRAYFLKEKVFWPTGEGVVPLELTPGNTERTLFLERVIKKTEVALEEYWILRKQTEAQYAPQQISASKMMIKLVSSLRWAVGYVNSKHLDSEALEKVRVIEIIK